MRAKKVSKEVGNVPPHTPCAGKPKAVLCIEGKGVVVKLDDKTIPLRRVKRNGAVGISDIASASLGPCGQVVYNQAYCEKSAERRGIEGGINMGIDGRNRERKVRV